MKELSKPIFLFLFIAATIVYLLGLNIDVMEIDAAQYASLSHEMLVTKSFTMLHFRQGDYLDKPPLCFWLEALSYSVFGVNNIAYKLPSFLFTLLGLFATYKLALSLYSKRIAQLSVLLLYTCQAFFLFNHDVRTDTVLTGAVIFAIWQLHSYLETRKLLNLLLGFVGVSAAMLAKGPLGLLVPVMAIVGELVFKRRWKDLFRPQWLLGLVIIAVLLLPMFIGLYNQYGKNGLRFYLWTQSFGRITGESKWNSHSDPFFFVHTFLWAFLPWAFLSLFAIVATITSLVKKSFKFKTVELLTISGTLLTGFAFSLSHYKLPHYIFVAFPLTAILTAAATFQLIEQFTVWRKLYKGFHFFMVFVLWILLYVILATVFPCHSVIIWIAIIALNLLAFYFLLVDKSDWSTIIIAPAVTIIAVNFMLNAHFYPRLLQYQAGKTIAQSKLDDKRPVYALDTWMYAFDFYAKKVVNTATDSTIDKIVSTGKPIYILTEPDGLNTLSRIKAKITAVQLFYDYPVTRLKLQFLNPATRGETLRKYYLVEVN